jgi:glycosyltransferase involved in cell wall biosynthesis
MVCANVKPFTLIVHPQLMVYLSRILIKYALLWGYTLKTMNRIAIFLSTSGHSGVDRAMKNLIPELARRGYRVDLLKVRKHGPELGTVPAGVRVIDLGSSHTYSCLPALVRYLRRETPAVLLADKDRVNRTALLARFIARSPCRLILSSGTTLSIDLQNRGGFERWLQRSSFKWLYPFADKLIVTSAGVADDTHTCTGLAREHIEVVPSPVIPDALLQQKLSCPDHPWFADHDIPLIISVGELCSRKDFGTLIRGFARLRQQQVCRLMILGRGKKKAALEQLAIELGVGEDVAFPGFVDSPYNYMAHADLFAFTSQWEGLGFVLIEALAVGTPVVSVDCPHGPAEILQQGKYGQLIAVGDDQALAIAMQQGLEQSLAPDALQEAAKPYTVSAATDAYLRVLGFSPAVS